MDRRGKLTMISAVAGAALLVVAAVLCVRAIVLEEQRIRAKGAKQRASLQAMVGVHTWDGQPLRLPRSQDWLERKQPEILLPPRDYQFDPRNDKMLQRRFQIHGRWEEPPGVDDRKLPGEGPVRDRLEKPPR